MRSGPEIESILVYVGSNPDDAIGENILKLPFLRVLKEKYPDARITWIGGVGPSQFQGILASVIDGQVDECLTDFEISDSARELFLRWRPLPGRRFDLIVDAQRNIVRTLVLRRIPHRIFVSGCWRFFLSDRKPPENLRRRSLLTDKMLALSAAAVGEAVYPSPVWPLPDQWRRAAAVLLPDGPVYVGLAPGAGKKGTGKCWPLDRYLALARMQQDRGRRPVFFIGPGETEWVDRIREGAPGSLIPSEDGKMVGLKDPALAMALAQRVRVGVANCSGIGHIMAAGGPPMVSLFGPTRPSKYAPYASSVIALRAQDFGPSGDIANIPLDAVSAAIEAQIERPRPGTGQKIRS
jgi:ADP-heptose:LPS heptosyltransferase